MSKTSVILALLILSGLMMGCSSPKTFVNYRVGDFDTTTQIIDNYEPIIIRPGDLLAITFNSTESESVSIFNNYQSGGYEVSENGEISFPLIGDLKLRGKTLDQAKEEILTGVSKYFVNPPVLNIKLLNFKVTINGAVSSPAILPVPTGRMNIIEAVTRAGDLTPYAQRDSVMIIREEGNTRSVGYVNFYSKDIFKSPYFYLKQNDIIYVKPNKNFVATVNTRPEKLRSFVSIGISVILLAINISRL